MDTRKAKRSREEERLTPKACGLRKRTRVPAEVRNSKNKPLTLPISLEMLSPTVLSFRFARDSG